jgi:hypothetical protein
MILLISSGSEKITSALSPIMPAATIAGGAFLQAHPHSHQS